MTLGKLGAERLEEIEAVTEDAWFISEVRPFVTELVGEVRRLQALEKRVTRLADAYEANADMLDGIWNIEDGMLHVMALSSRSAAKLIRERLTDDNNQV